MFKVGAVTDGICVVAGIVVLLEGSPQNLDYAVKDVVWKMGQTVGVDGKVIL
jgi:hypothetical protein